MLRKLLVVKGLVYRGCSRVLYNYEYRSFSVQPPQRGRWSSLSESQRAAWEILGWNEDRWEGRQSPPETSSLAWSKLSPAQQAAAIHGLHYSQQEWDSKIFNDDSIKDIGVARQRSEQKSVTVDPSLFGTSSASPVKPNETIASSLGRFVKNVAKAVAPGQVETMEDKMAAPVVVNDVETTVYLDDSPSMNFNTEWFSFTSRLEQGKKALHWLAPVLGEMPCRVLKFSNKPTVLRLRDEVGSISSSLPTIDLGWDAKGRGTYMWHMIETDVRERYRPGTGKLRLVVVTDGDDTLSPPGYTGMRGMDPMMRTLQDLGYDIEWHIIVVGGESGLERYRALSGASGGSFLSIKREFNENSDDAKALLQALKRAKDNHDRHKRQQQYEIDARSGKVDKVDWYKQLPPPK